MGKIVLKEQFKIELSKEGNGNIINSNKTSFYQGESHTYYFSPNKLNLKDNISLKMVI